MEGRKFLIGEVIQKTLVWQVEYPSELREGFAQMGVIWQRMVPIAVDAGGMIAISVEG